MDTKPLEIKEPSSDEVFQYMIDNPAYSYYNAREILRNISRERAELRRALLEEQSRLSNES